MSARRKVDPGWLTLQRERYGPDYRPPARRSIHQAGDLIPEVLKKMGMEPESRISDFQDVWAEVAGAANAGHSRPGRWERGVLTVYVDHHLWLAELQRFAGNSLLQRLQEKFGKTAVRQLRFELEPAD